MLADSRHYFGVKPAKVTISLSRPAVVYGRSVKLSGVVSNHQAGEHVITAADPLPDDVHQILEAIKTQAATH